VRIQNKPTLRKVTPRLLTTTDFATALQTGQLIMTRGATPNPRLIRQQQQQQPLTLPHMRPTTINTSAGTFTLPPGYTVIQEPFMHTLNQAAAFQAPRYISTNGAASTQNAGASAAGGYAITPGGYLVATGGQSLQASNCQPSSVTSANQAANAQAQGLQQLYSADPFSLAAVNQALAANQAQLGQMVGYQTALRGTNFRYSPY